MSYDKFKAALDKFHMDASTLTADDCSELARIDAKLAARARYRKTTGDLEPILPPDASAAEKKALQTPVTQHDLLLLLRDQIWPLFRALREELKQR